MKNIMRVFIILFLLLSVKCYPQQTEYHIFVTDENNQFGLLSYLKIDDNQIITPDSHLYLNDTCLFIVTLPEGKHRIQGELSGYSLIDTIVEFNPSSKQINLRVNMKDDFYLYEFREGFEKVYDGETAIGLRDDGTFLRKSFFHVSIVGCFQLEEGQYRIEGDNLILDVDKYGCPCFKYPGQMQHQYVYTLKDGDVIDLNKYDGFIEYKYFGLGKDRWTIDRSE